MCSKSPGTRPLVADDGFAWAVRKPRAAVTSQDRVHRRMRSAGRDRETGWHPHIDHQSDELNAVQPIRAARYRAPSGPSLSVDLSQDPQPRDGPGRLLSRSQPAWARQLAAGRQTARTLLK